MSEKNNKEIDDSCEITTKTLDDGTKEFCLDCGDNERIEFRYKGKDTEFFESITTMAKMKSVIFKKEEKSPEE